MRYLLSLVFALVLGCGGPLPDLGQSDVTLQADPVRELSRTECHAGPITYERWDFGRSFITSSEVVVSDGESSVLQVVRPGDGVTLVVGDRVVQVVTGLSFRLTAGQHVVSGAVAGSIVSVDFDGVGATGSWSAGWLAFPFSGWTVYISPSDGSIQVWSQGRNQVWFATAHEGLVLAATAAESWAGSCEVRP